MPCSKQNIYAQAGTAERKYAEKEVIFHLMDDMPVLHCILLKGVKKRCCQCRINADSWGPTVPYEGDNFANS